MSNPAPFKIATWVEDTINEPNFVRLVNSIEHALSVKITNWSEEKISEVADSSEEDVFNELTRLIELRKKRGIDPTFHIEGEPGTYYIKGINLESLGFLEQLRELKPGDFEDFCALLLKELGGTSRRTGKSNDGGVDFIAENVSLSNRQISALKGSSVYVIGQAKRYQGNNYVSVKEVRDFLGGGVVKFLEKTEEKGDELGFFSPVIYAFWTTSNFTYRAEAFAQKAGIWYLNGLALAQLALKLNIEITRS